MDDDGNTTETFIRGVGTIDFTPPREIISHTDAATINEPHAFSQDNMHAEIDSNIFLRTTVFNNSVATVSDISMITVLPSLGDHSIVPNASGEYLPRNSTFSAPLVNSLESVASNQSLLAKWDILYSTSPQGSTLEATKSAVFVPASQITDWSQVKMVQMKLKPNQTMNVKEEANFVIPVKIPNNKTLQAGNIARASTAISFNGRDFLESEATTMTIARYKISGKIFDDLNKNGQKDDNENFISSHTVTIKNEAGQIVGTTRTNENGEYSYDVFREGKYSAEIAKRTAADEFSPVVVNSTNSIVGNSATLENNIFKTPMITFSK